MAHRGPILRFANDTGLDNFAATVLSALSRCHPSVTGSSSSSRRWNLSVHLLQCAVEVALLIFVATLVAFGILVAHFGNVTE